MDTFIRDFPNADSLLVLKIAFLLGVFGLLRLKELLEIEWKHVTVKDDFIVIQIERYEFGIDDSYMSYILFLCT